MNLIYIAQFHETCGYTHAAHGYLKSIDEVLEKFPHLNIKILSVSLDRKKISLQYHHNKTDQSTIDLLDKYHVKDQQELNELLEADYRCIWHMTSILPIIFKRPGAFNCYRDLEFSVEEIILGAEENYHILAWETDEIPQEYKSSIVNYNPKKVITPSEWNTSTVSKFFSSITIPHLIEENRNVKTDKVSLPDFEEKFVILSVSEWNHRKNFECLVKSFTKNFWNNDDTLLVIKTSLPPGLSKEDMIKQLTSYRSSVRTIGEKKQNIVLIVDYLSSEKMNFLYNHCDVFCLTSLGEGFSLPLSEAVKFGKPVICPGQGGHIDYLDKENRYFIDGHWDTVFDDPPYDPDGSWYVPTVKSTSEKLELAYRDWLWDPEQLNKSASNNKLAMNKGTFSKDKIGNLLIKTVTSKIDKPESKISLLKRKIQNKTLHQKMDILYNSYAGEDCYILNCGPSINDYDKEKLEEFLRDKLVLSVKQAYDKFPSVTDFHFFNCSNIPSRQNPFLPHYMYDKETISIASSNYDRYHRWSMLQTSDIFFKIPIRTEINNEFLVRTGKIDEFLIENKVDRPCGPGIMYETVLFTALHLGVKSLTCIGWDLTMKKVNQSNYNHFYGSTENLINRGDILDWEIDETRDFSKNFYEWCVKNNIELKLASNKSSLYDKIPRVNLEF